MSKHEHGIRPVLEMIVGLSFISLLIGIAIAKSPKPGQRFEIQEVHAQAPQVKHRIELVDYDDGGSWLNRWAVYRDTETQTLFFCRGMEGRCEQIMTGGAAH